MSGYAIDPFAPLPKRWEDEHGEIRVMCEPHEGYVMARRKGCIPFVIRVIDLLSGEYEPIIARRTTKGGGE